MTISRRLKLNVTVVTPPREASLEIVWIGWNPWDGRGLSYRKVVSKVTVWRFRSNWT